MSDAPSYKRASAPAVSPSLVPSDLPGTMLPFGPPPATLVEMETAHGAISEDLRRQVRALADNANRIRSHSPLKAAICWHEAGRILDWRAGRSAQAWDCYSRAVYIYPDHKPALSGLRRLARRAGTTELLGKLIEAHTDRATEPTERAALLTESALLELRQGHTGATLDMLREAIRSYPEALVAQLLKVNVAIREGDEEDLAETFSSLADRWPEPSVSKELQVTLALIEERLGRLDAALERLDTEAAESRLSLAGYWARIRLCLRLNHGEDACAAIGELVDRIEDPVMSAALKRLRAAVGAFIVDEQTDGERSVRGGDANAEDPVWDLELVSAARKKDRGRAADAAGKLKALVRGSRLKEALAAYGMSAEWKPGVTPADLDAAISPEQAVGRAVASFLGISKRSETENVDTSKIPPSVAADLYGALSRREWERVAYVLSTLRERSNDERDRWSLAVAESAVYIEHLDRADDALSMLRGETDRLNRPPLPALIRAYDSRGESLAELAISEAEDSDSDEFKAWRFAWAGHHMEPTDHNEAGRLYLRALEIIPSLPMGMDGLERTVSDRSVLAEACLNAAGVAVKRDNRARFLLRAAVQYLAQGSASRATELFGEALELYPDDTTLRNTVTRLALTHLEAASPEYVQGSQKDWKEKEDNFIALGSLGLEVDPHEAVGWFKKALEARPEDPIAKAGYQKALLNSGQTTIVSADLLKQLGEAGSPEEEAMILARLAHLNRRFEDDISEAILASNSIHERLPGHRSTLARLLTHHLIQGKRDELHRVLTGLSMTSGDNADVAAFTAAAWRLDSSEIDALRGVVERNPDSLIELAQLEGLTEDTPEQLKLLERLAQGPDNSTIYSSRLAEALGEAGEHQRAAELYKNILEADTDSMFDLFASSRHYRAIQDHLALVDSLSRIASLSSMSEYKVEMLLEAAEIAHTELKDTQRAARLYLDVLAIDPENDHAYKMSRELLDTGAGKDEPGKPAGDGPSAADRSAVIELLETRLRGVRESWDQKDIRLELATVLLEGSEAGERDKAKEHLEEALKIEPQNLESRQLLAQVYREDGEWSDAIEHLMEAARFVKKSDVGIEIFYTLGELYMDHTIHEDLAEKSFIKVLGWDRSHFKAMERISNLYLRMGNLNRSAQALEHLVRLSKDPVIKVDKMIRLARIYEEHLGRSKDAEKLLSDARSLDPREMAPVEALAEIFKRQGDTLALNIHLDGALASQAALLVEEPDREDVYANIQKILELKEDGSLGALAAEAVSILGSASGTPRTSMAELRWEAGARVGNPSLEEYICPKSIPAGLRETMKATEETIAKLEGVSAKQIGGDKTEKLNRNSPLARMLVDLAPAFGVDIPTALIDTESGLRIGPGSPATIVFPKSLAKIEDSSVLHFCVTSSLQMIRLGLSLATVLRSKDLRRLFGAVVSLSTSGYVPKGLDKREVESTAARIRTTLPSKTLDQIRPFAFDCQAAIDRATLRAEILDVGYRTGFIGAGSIRGAFVGLRTLFGLPRSSLSELPGAGRLMSFVFSRDHIELRTRMGI
ncbi:MAG: tetratricopeptide repeat protein [Deltaproteobacteria bacterium]|nr:tetratricopeptide repeat protein [Deltaproteobacteria bacterium]